MLALGKRGRAVIDRRERIAGALHHDIDLWMANQRMPIVTHVCSAELHGFVDSACQHSLGAPAHTRQVDAPHHVCGYRE